MAKFVISPHFRLHEWVAEEKGYFRAEGLDYEFRNVFKTHATPNKVGAMTSFEQGRETNVSCACHWTVNVAASQGHGKMYADAYSISPSGVFVPPESPIREPGWRPVSLARAGPCVSPGLRIAPRGTWSCVTCGVGLWVFGPASPFRRVGTGGSAFAASPLRTVGTGSPPSLFVASPLTARGSRARRGRCPCRG